MIFNYFSIKTYFWTLAVHGECSNQSFLKGFGKTFVHKSFPNIPFHFLLFVIVFVFLTFPLFAETPKLSETSELSSNEPEEEYEDEYAEASAPSRWDPLETLNHWIFQFNDKMYFWVLKPVAKGIKTVLPEKARISVRNFFDHWHTPIRFVNCALQGQWKETGIEACRFGINTTIGFLGFFDPAKTRWKLESKDEDLGQTLARYGVPEGHYLVLPFFGPSTLRDSVGMVVDFLLSPFFYLPNAWPVAVRSVEITNDTSLHLGDYESLKKAAIDPYDSFRDVYSQYRKEKIKK